MKSLLVGLLCISLAVAIDQSLIQLGTEKIEELSKTNLGKFIIDLAQTHGEMRGPLDDLISAIHDLEADLTSELESLDTEYTRTSNQHQVTQQNLDLDIGSSEIAVNNNIDMIDNILIPGEDQATQRINKINQFMNDNRDSLQRETLERQKNHQTYLDKVSENQGGISAIDEALQLVSQLMNGNLSLTELSQKRILHQSVKLIESRLNKQSEFSPIIQALLSLAQNFADQSQVKKIWDLLNETRTKLVDSLNEETADEKVRVATFQEREQGLNAEYNDFKKSVLEATYVLTAYQNKLVSVKESLAQNRADLEVYQESLRVDQQTQADETGLYNELRTQYLGEIQTVRNASEFINSAEFTNVMHSKLNSGGLI